MTFLHLGQKFGNIMNAWYDTNVMVSLSCHPWVNQQTEGRMFSMDRTLILSHLEKSLVHRKTECKL